MILSSLYLRNFRNFEEATFTFGPGLNVFHGLNGQGKTNLLEAIILISTGKSFRTQALSELISEGTKGFFVEATLHSQAVSQVLRLSFDGKERELFFNRNRATSWIPLLGLLPSVLYAPRDVDLIDGSPATRRRFLNIHLAQSDPAYMHHYVRFTRALKQRNALLKGPSQESIGVWEQEMAESAALLLVKRTVFLEELQSYLLESCKTLATESVDIHYCPSQTKAAPYSSSYLAQLQKNRAKEQLLGLTLTGPHRDDFHLLIQKKPAQLFASEGQKRCALAALRLAEWQRLEGQMGRAPLFGIDDFELHLDPERQTLLRSALCRLGQVFVTTPLSHPTWEGAQLFPVRAPERALK